MWRYSKSLHVSGAAVQVVQLRLLAKGLRLQYQAPLRPADEGGNRSKGGVCIFDMCALESASRSTLDALLGSTIAQHSPLCPVGLSGLLLANP
jgi:hypothetical protein